MLFNTTESNDLAKMATETQDLKPRLNKRSRKQQFDRVRSVEMEVYGLTWLRCNYTSCTRIFQDLAKLKHHEDYYHAATTEYTDSLGNSRFPSSSPTLRLPGNRNEIIEIKNLKIILQRVDSLINPVNVQMDPDSFNGGDGPIEQPSTSDWVPHPPPRLIVRNPQPPHTKEQEIWICEEEGCKSSFTKISRLHEHIAISHSQGVPVQGTFLQFQCQQCPIKFKTFSLLARHIRRVHVNLICFKCQHCGKEFNDAYNGRRHEETHTMRFDCIVCRREFKNSAELHRHEKTHGRLIYKYNCRMCSKTFKAAKYLKFHELTHRLKRTFKCQYCDNSYKHAAGLRRHKQVFHDISFYCKTCNEEFTTVDQLNEHEKFHETSFKYKFCGKIFKYEPVLQDDPTAPVLIDNGVYQNSSDKSESVKYNCGFCGKVFQLQGNRINHEKKVHFEMYVSKYGGSYSCQCCGARFQYQSLLADHQLNCSPSPPNLTNRSRGCKIEIDPLGISPLDAQEHTPSDPFPTFDIKIERVFL